MKILVHKVAIMEDKPKFVPKFSFNPVKINVFSQYYDSNHISFLIFYWGYRQFCKVFAHFYQLFTCLSNKNVCKTLALAGTCKYTVI